jgi:hypothetical protein
MLVAFRVLGGLIMCRKTYYAHHGYLRSGLFSAVKACANGFQSPISVHGKSPCFSRCSFWGPVAPDRLLSDLALVAMEDYP